MIPAQHIKDWSRLASTVVRGRDAEIEMLDGLVAAASSGDGRVVLIDGPSGIGKTRLAEEVADRARRRGMRVLHAEAAAGTRGHVDPLLAALLGDDPPIVDPAALRARDGGADDARYWIMHEVFAALAAAAGQVPLVIIMDDLHAADGDTITAVRMLSSRLRNTGALWILAGRRVQASPVVHETLNHLQRDGGVELRLGPLTSTAGLSLVEDFVRATALPPLLKLVREARGHPYWILELLRGLSEEGRLRITGGTATVVGTGLPQRVTTAMDERLRALSPTARQVIRMAAVLPPRFTATHLAGLLRGRLTELIEPLDETLRADLLTVTDGDIRFSHDLLRHAAREVLPESLRRALGREVANALLLGGADPADVAALLAETAEAGDRAATSELHAVALTIPDPTVAADLLLRALGQLPPEDEEHGAVTVDALVRLHRAGRFDRARDLTGQVLAEYLPEEREAEVRLYRSTVNERPPSDRADDNRTALLLRGTTAGIRARHQAWLAWNLLENGDTDEAERVARASGGAARLALAGVHSARGAGTLASADLDRLTATGPRPDDPDTGLHYLGIAGLLHHLGRTKDATSALIDCLREARRTQDLPLLDLCTQLAATACLLTGRLDEARTQALSEPATGDSAGLATALRMTTLAGLGQYLGDAALTRSAVATAQRWQTSENPTGRRSADRVLITAAAGRGDAEQAARLLRDDPLLPDGLPLPADLTFLVLAARVARAARDRALLERLVAVATTLEVGAADAPAFGATAAHVHGLAAGNAEQLLAAAKLQDAAGRPLLSAVAMEDAGQTMLGDDLKEDGVRWLHEGLSAYTTWGAVASAQRLRRLLREHGAVRRVGPADWNSGWDRLTESELKVVRLIASGETNRSAARQLFLSVHTVNSHVRNVFTKLGVSSRVQLAHVLRDNDG